MRKDGKQSSQLTKQNMCKIRDIFRRGTGESSLPFVRMFADHLSFCLSVGRSVGLSVCRSVDQSVGLCVGRSVGLSVGLSACL